MTFAARIILGDIVWEPQILNSKNPTSERDPYWAHIAPFAAFMLVLSVPDLLSSLGLAVGGDLAKPAGVTRQLWLYPLQTAICLSLLSFYRRSYPWRPVRGILWGVLGGVIGIGLWLLPGFLFQRFQVAFPFSDSLGFVDRSGGFNPLEQLKDSPAAAAWFWLTRLLRLIVIVPIIEEIFWRSFLMRFLADSKREFYQSPFGQNSTIGLLVVTGMFVAAHQPADYFGATCYGLLAYWLTVNTKSLTSVIVMHATANALLAVYAVAFHQWGYL